jgi:hypothetical protein
VNLVLKALLNGLEQLVEQVKGARGFLLGRSGLFSAWLRSHRFERLSVPD